MLTHVHTHTHTHNTHTHTHTHMHAYTQTHACMSTHTHTAITGVGTTEARLQCLSDKTFTLYTEILQHKHNSINYGDGRYRVQ